MSIVLSDYIRFPFNGGRGIRTDQLKGAIVQSITEAGVATVTLDNGSPATVTLATELVRADRDPDADDFAARRLFYDGIELRKVIRIPVPGHDRAVVFADDNLNIALLGTGIYVDRNAASDANPFNTRPTGQRYYNRSLARWELWQVGEYWDSRRSVAEPQSAQGSLWIGEWPNEEVARSHVSHVGQITSYPDDDGEYILHGVTSITPGVEDGFRYELDPLFSAYALDNADIDNAESDVQGMVSGRGIARGVEEHERFTDVEQDILEDLSRQTFPHPNDDWLIRQTYAVHDFFTDRNSVFLSLGWDADNRLRALSADGHVGRLGRHDQGRIYDGSETLRAGLISGVNWLYLRDDGAAGSAIIRAPVDGGDSDPEFQIVLRYFSMFADPDSGTLIGILRRISSTEMEIGLLAYDAVAGTITAEDTITVTRVHLDAVLGADYAPLLDIHRESASGVYQEVAGAILEGDTLYLMLTDIAKTDGHTASVLVGFTLAGTPNNRTLTVLSENAVDELPVSDELTSGILPLEADELFLVRPLSAYRLSPESESTTYALENDDIDNPESDVQGTVSGRGLERAVYEYSPFTDVEAGLGDKADRDLGNLTVTEFVATENVQGDAIEKDKLSVNVRNEIDRGGFVVSGLQYRINHLETSANDARSTDWVGGVFQVHRDVYMNGGSFRITENSPGTHRTYHLSIVKLFQNAEDDWRLPNGDPDVPYWDMRINRDGDGFDSDWADHYQLDSGHAAHGYMECRSPDVTDPLVIREGEFFGLMSRISTSGVDEQYYAIGFIGQTDGAGYDDLLDAVTEQDHNHPDFDHEIFTYMGEIHSGHNGRDLQGRPIMTSDNVRNFAYRMSLDYAIHEAELLTVDTDDIENDAVTRPKLSPDVRADLDSASGSGRVARILDVTDSDDWVESRNYTDTTELVGVNRTARYISWLDGNLYLADTAGQINTRDLDTNITGMARGNGLFLTNEGNNVVVRDATDLTQLSSQPYGTRHAIAVQQDDASKFWSLSSSANGNIVVREVTISDAGVVSIETVRHTITVAAMNTVLGDRYFDVQSLYDNNLLQGLIDIHVVSSSEFWILFAGIPLTHDLTSAFTVMIKAEIPDGSSTFQLVTDSLEEFPRDDGRSFVRIGDGLVYFVYDGGVARYEKKSARAEVYREHQQDNLRRITSSERNAGTEDGLVGFSPFDVADMISSHTTGMQQGNVQVGDDQWTHIYWQRAASIPASPSFGVWNGNSWSGTVSPWAADRATAVSQVGSDPIWMAFGRSSRDTSGIITTHAWSVVAEFGLQYSEVGGYDNSDWHAVQATTDNFLRMRLPDGTYTPQLHLTSVTGADTWTHIATGGLLNTGGMDAIDIGFRTIPFSGGLEGYESLLLTATPQPIGANEVGIILSKIIRRGGPDWGLDLDVDDVPRAGCYNVVYDVNDGLIIGRIEDDDWRPDQGDDLRQTVSGITLATRMSWRFKFNSPDADPANINAIRNFAFKSTNFVRMRLELFGR